jgi:hypothetical protein
MYNGVGLLDGYWLYLDRWLDPACWPCRGPWPCVMFEYHQICHERFDVDAEFLLYAERPCHSNTW